MLDFLEIRSFAERRRQCPCPHCSKERTFTSCLGKFTFSILFCSPSCLTWAQSKWQAFHTSWWIRHHHVPSQSLGDLPIGMDASTPPHPHWLRICGTIQYLLSTHCMWRFCALLPALCQRVAAVQIWLWLCYFSQAALSRREDKKCIQFAQITAWS